MSGWSATKLRDLLTEVRTIAILGLSAKPSRPSNEVARFLVAHGYECVGVNPGIVGQIVHGMPIFARLGDVPHPVDMVDIFRASHVIGQIVDEILTLDPKPRIIWTQLGVRDEQAKVRAEASGLTVVMDNCPKIVLSR